MDYWRTAFYNGPDGTLEGKFATEQPIFIHHSCAFYLAGCITFLEGEDEAYSWNNPSASSSDFDTFVAGYQYGVGVQVSNVYEVKEVDEEYFEAS